MRFPKRRSGATSAARWTSTVSAGFLAVVLLAGCSPSGPDVSQDGRIDYACALAQQAQGSGPAADWTVTPGSADRALNEAAAAAALLGGMTGTHIEGHEGLSEAAMVQYAEISRASEGLQRGIDDVVAACHDADLPRHGPDVSPDGQLAYACALVADAGQAGATDTWDPMIGDDAEPAMVEALGAAAPSGALSATPLPDHAEVTDAGQQIYDGATRIDVERLQDGLDAFSEACG